MSKVLTVKAIGNFKPGASRREVPDGDVRGLYLQIFPSGKASWAFRYRFGGRTRKLTIGASPEIGLKDARDLASLLDRIDQEALLRIPVAQFLFGNGLGNLLVDLAARIGVPEYEFGHYWLTSPETSVAPAGIWNLNLASSTAGFSFSCANWKARMD